MKQIASCLGATTQGRQREHLQEGQAGSSVNPAVFCSCRGNAQSGGGLSRGQAGEKTQFHEFRLAGIFPFELLQCLIQAQDVVTGYWQDHRIDGFQGDTHAITTTLQALLLPSPFDQDPPHGFGSRSE
jgi:hypothetical protein